MNAYLKIIRPGNAVMGIIAVILMAIIGTNYNIPIILGAIAVFLAMGGGNVINDYFDHEIDAINKPERPIPSGRISLKNAKIYSYFLFIIAILIGIIISYLVNSYIPLLIVIISSLLMYYYAHTLKKIALIGNLSISFLTSLCFIFGGFIIGLETKNIEIIITSFYLGFFAFVITVAREITKDMEDIEGDKIEKAKTFPILYGKKNSSYLSGFLMVLASVLSPILYFNGIFNFYYLLVLALAIITFFYGACTILKDQSPISCKKASKLVKIGMIISFITFAIGSF
ncbi:Digeranylgeranylglyceryl phosphate synthase [Candidatus Methanobinarius endosymbioticus]|uniref:Digeranylgeranylglyceryl phosphate synthase n=1 Tax=Candidatus Methanobinarius endosymbioticus TaxID=2006182 RepID=A0A366M9M9_9EURY|nr:Digeranylgeranylglyceryl phosphate synthase [Candidatus Methanobinarius endosymbioticus]